MGDDSEWVAKGEESPLRILFHLEIFFIEKYFVVFNWLDDTGRIQILPILQIHTN